MWLQGAWLGVVGMLVLACGKSQSGRVLVFVSNEDSGDISVIDAQSRAVVRSISVGKRPRGLRVSPDGQSLFVALSGSVKARPGAPRDDRDDDADGIGVIDIRRGELVRVLPAGRDPESFDVTPDGKTLYVSNEETAEVSIVDVASGHVRGTVAVGAEPEGVSVRPDGRFVYVTSEASNEIDVIATGAERLVARIPAASRPRAIAFAKDRGFATAENSGVVHVVDLEKNVPLGAVKAGEGGARPMGIAVSADGERAYVGNGRHGSVGVIDLRAQRLDRTIDAVGARAWGVALTPDGKHLYVAAGPDVAVIDTATSGIVARIPVGTGPWGVAVATVPKS
ncbi:beta-propeller fold lactonase family protein [Pendulispora brunnea]|uniref:Beta-propeller fold lactonase family protein n=1 Tax=Pendulispora brunnea TaxID=2905690 RepID=A0ABZ2K9M8_9BACT